jgi:hypothetical protein
MRFLIVICFLLNFSGCFSQIQMVLSFPEYNIVYRGYNNVLAVSTRTKVNPEFIELNCDGALLQHRENNEWTLNPFTTADSLEIRMIHSKTKEIIDRFVYRVRNLPDPELFLGAVQSGGKIDHKETRLFTLYSNSPLKAEFSVFGGEVFVGNNSYAFCITNNRLGTDYLQYIQNMPVGTKVYVKALVRGVDKMERIVYAEYVL